MSASPDIAKIVVSLPKDRLTAGALAVYMRDGGRVARFPCRGKADSARAAQAGNPKRDPAYPYGDAPAGDYGETWLNLFGEDHPRYGIGWIPLFGVYGQAWRARQNGRTGLGIHAGRGDEKLIATYGCIRMLDRDFKKLAELVGHDRFTVTVEDV